MDALQIDAIRFFILLVFPGLISMHIYRLLIPARRIDWSNVLFEGLFYSGINFALLSPFIIFLHHNDFSSRHPFLYACSGWIILVIAPIIWPNIYVKIIRSKRLIKRLQLPYPTAWDYFFDKRDPVFVLIHLKDRNMVGGYFGSDSFATAYPDEGDIYVQDVYKVNDDGTFDKKIDSTKGLLIRKDEYSYIELFNVL